MRTWLQGEQWFLEGTIADQQKPSPSTGISESPPNAAQVSQPLEATDAAHVQPPLPKLVTEQEAYERFADLLEARELRRARTEKRIGHYVRKNKIHYREDELIAFIGDRLQESYHPRQPTGMNPFSASGNTGSVDAPACPTSTVSGMTPELERSGADLLRQQISKMPRSRSPRSSSSRAEEKPPSRKT